MSENLNNEHMMKGKGELNSSDNSDSELCCHSTLELAFCRGIESGVHCDTTEINTCIY